MRKVKVALGCVFETVWTFGVSVGAGLLLLS